MTRIGVPIERMDDAALLSGLSSGMPEMAVAFVRRFQGHVYGVALAVVGDKTLAEDVAQQAFERAWRRSGTFHPERGGVRPWLTAITHNLAVDSLRARRPMPVDPADLVRLLGPTEHEPESRVMASDSNETLRGAIRKLPPEQARALVMAGVYRMTAQEVSEAEGIPVGTAKTRIRAAMTKIRQDLTAKERTND